MGSLILHVALCCLLTATFCKTEGENVEVRNGIDYEEILYEPYEWEPQVIENLTIPQLQEVVEEKKSINLASRSLQDFSFDILNALKANADAENNVVISPLSIYTALSMLRPGLTGEALLQVDDVMGTHSLSNDDIGDLLQAIHTENPNYKLKYANRVYIDKTLKFSKTYNSQLKRLNVVQARKMDFKGNEKESRNKMNRYVKNRTKRLIEQLIPEGAVTSNTKIYLVNALYIKANWNFRFSKGSTEKLPFRVDKSTQILVPTMQTKYAICTFHRDARTQTDVVVLPLAESLSMIFIMPLQPGNFTGLYNDETETMKSKIGRIFNEIWTDENNGESIIDICSLTLPKFKIEYETNLITDLRRLGITDIFDPHDADLSLMTQSGEDDIYVSDARHKAVLEANEGGIEAAAGSSVGIESRSAHSGLKVHLDKPFIFAVKQDSTGAILFLGKVIRPHSN